MINHKTWVEISKQALIFNLKQFRKIIGQDKKLAAIIKSNAYGHGLQDTAQILAKSEADWFGVDSIDEAIAIKQENNKTIKQIIILGYTVYNHLSEVIKNEFRQIVYNSETIKKLGELSSKLKKRTYLHIKLETGTSRQGVLEKDLSKIVKLIKKYPYLVLEGASTHFANIEDTTDHSYAEQQLKNFQRLINLAEKEYGQKIKIKHTACSAATILFPETHFDLVRLGISMYGLWSSSETKVSASHKKINLSLKPVLSWKTIVAQVKKLKSGTPISYGLTETLHHDSTIAILPIGYNDGFDRKLSNIGNVLIKGKRCKILGRICMNMCVVDVSHIKNLKPEDEVVLIGKQGKEQITADEIAKKINTINYEIVTRINPLIKRVIVK
ncbi:MAG: alanine racemase [Patescibacteria group bacterium]|nr:alanine racemase [Patescibacteria group bacterium]